MLSRLTAPHDIRRTLPLVMAIGCVLGLENCISNSPISSDIWCNATCSQNATGACPSNLCVCGSEAAALEYPGTCTALPGSTATDQWCAATCTGAGNWDCSAQLCTCSGWAGVGGIAGNQIQSCVALNSLATETWCLASCRFGVCPEYLCKCFTSDADRLEYEIWLTLGIDVHPYEEDFDCCLAAQDRVWFIQDGDLYKWTINGKKGTPPASEPNLLPVLVAEFDNAIDIEMEINDGIWISDWGAAKIYRYNATTGNLTEIASWHQHQVDAAKSITICHENVYAATTNAVVKLSFYPDYTFKSKETFMYHTGNLLDITCLPDGNILAVMNDRIQVIDHDSKEITPFITNSLEQRLPDIQDVDYLETCGLVFTVPDANQIWRCPFLNDSSTCGIHCPWNGTDADSCQHIENPWGISMDCDCNIFVTSKANGNIVWYEGSPNTEPNQRDWNMLGTVRDPSNPKLRQGVMIGGYIEPQDIEVYAPITDGLLLPDGSDPCNPPGTCGASLLHDDAGCAASSATKTLANATAADFNCADPDDCTVNECCVEPDTCGNLFSTDAECEAVGGYDLVDPGVDPNAYCVNTTCEAAECCKPKGICSDASLTTNAQCESADPGGNTLVKVPLPAYCSGVQCTPDECCDAPEMCGARYIDPNNPGAQSSMQCMLEASQNNNDLMFVKAGATATTRCAALECTQEECCMGPSSCSADMLNTDARCLAFNPAYPLANPDANSTVCNFPECEATECCRFSSPSPTPSPEQAIFFSTSFSTQDGTVAQSGTGQTVTCNTYPCSYEWALSNLPLMAVKIEINVQHKISESSTTFVAQDENGESFYTCKLIDRTYDIDSPYLRACQQSDPADPDAPPTPLEPVVSTEVFGTTYYKCPDGADDQDGAGVGTAIEVETLSPSTNERDTLGYTGHGTDTCSIVPQRKHIVTNDENGINYLDEPYQPRVYFRDYDNNGVQYTSEELHNMIQYGWQDDSSQAFRDYSWDYLDANVVPNWDNTGRQNSGWVTVINCENVPADTEFYVAYPLPHIKYLDPLFGPRNNWLVNDAGIDEYDPSFTSGAFAALAGVKPWVLYNSTMEAQGFYRNSTTGQTVTPYWPGSPLRIDNMIEHGVDAVAYPAIRNQWNTGDDAYEWKDKNGDVLQDTDPRRFLTCADVCSLSNCVGKKKR